MIVELSYERVNFPDIISIRSNVRTTELYYVNNALKKNINENFMSLLPLQM